MARAPITSQSAFDATAKEYQDEFGGGVRRFIIRAVLVIGFLFTLTVIFGSYYTVGYTERAILTRNGNFVGVSEPGLHFKTPIIDDYVRMSNLPKTYSWDKLAAYSRDQQPADMKVSVTYHIGSSQVEEYFKNYGSDEDSVMQNFISPRLQKDIKEIFGTYTAAESINNRAELGKKITESLLNSLEGKPVTIDGVQIENIDFSDAYETAVEDRMKAEVDVAKQQQTLRKEQILAEIAVTQAKGQADSIKAKADANAYQTKVQGDAEAGAIKAKSDALKENPLYIQYVQASQWNGKLPSTMLPGNSVPMLNLEQSK